jgi:hypothetical protein
VPVGRVPSVLQRASLGVVSPAVRRPAPVRPLEIRGFRTEAVLSLQRGGTRRPHHSPLRTVACSRGLASTCDSGPPWNSGSRICGRFVGTSDSERCQSGPIGYGSSPETGPSSPSASPDPFAEPGVVRSSRTGRAMKLRGLAGESLAGPRLSWQLSSPPFRGGRPRGPLRIRAPTQGHPDRLVL